MNPASGTPPFILVTDHGTHSPEKWAKVIAKMVCPISPDIQDERRPLAVKAQDEIAEVIRGLVGRIIDRERTVLEIGTARYDQPFDGVKYVDAALDGIFKISDATPWKIYLRTYEDFLRWELQRHFDHVQHVERLWHADNHTSEAGGKYKSRYTGEY